MARPLREIRRNRYVLEHKKSDVFCWIFYSFLNQALCHPGISSYLRQLLKSIRAQLEIGKVEKVAFVVVDKEQRPIERFVFEMEVKQSIPVTEK